MLQNNGLHKLRRLYNAHHDIFLRIHLPLCSLFGTNELGFPLKGKSA